MQFGKISSVQNFFIVPKNAFPAFKTVALTGKVAANAQRQTVIFIFSGSGLLTELFGGGQWSLKAMTSVVAEAAQYVQDPAVNHRSKLVT